jgi:hypothetical protein
MEIKLINFMLEKKVRKSLIETKERKEKLLIEETLIKNRLSIILEGVNSDKEFKSLSEKKQLRISSKFIQELSYLQETKLINEQNLGSLMQSLFGGWFGNLTQTIFEPMFKKILTPLFGEGFFTNFLTAYLTSRPSDVIKSFNDCKLMTKLVAEGISEAIVMQVQESQGLTGSGYSFIRNTMGDVLTGSSFISGIEKGIGNTVCSLLGKFSNNAKKVVEKVKGDGSAAVGTAATNVTDAAKTAATNVTDAAKTATNTVKSAIA